MNQRVRPKREHFTLAILHAAGTIEAQLEQSLGEVGLSMARLKALSALATADAPMPLSDLAARLSCVRSNVTQLVDRLEADGLVRRVHDRDDRRSVRAELTETGREKQIAGEQTLANAQREIAKRISAADLGSLEVALEALI